MMENHVFDLENKLNNTLEHFEIIKFELEDNKNSSFEQIERLKQQLKGNFLNLA